MAFNKFHSAYTPTMSEYLAPNHSVSVIQIKDAISASSVVIEAIDCVRDSWKLLYNGGLCFSKHDKVLFPEFAK